jgi:hypothetical protein
MDCHRHMEQELLQQVIRPGDRDWMDCHLLLEQEQVQQVTRSADNHATINYILPVRDLEFGYRSGDRTNIDCSKDICSARDWE